MKKIFYIFIILSISCSKARIEKFEDNIITTTDNKIRFIPLNNYFKAKQKKPELLKSNLKYPFDETSKGTIFIWANKLSFPNGTIFNYNTDTFVNCSLLELYKIKDFIFYDKQAVKDNKLLNTVVIFNFYLYKNNQELKIVSPEPGIELRNIVSEQNVIYNVMLYDNLLNNWYDSGNFHENNNGDTFFKKEGWACIANYAEFQTTSYTKLNFTSNKYDLTNVGIYVVFSNKNTFTRVQNLESIDLPIGEQAKLVAFGITNENQLYSYSKEIIIGEETTYSIDLTTTNDAFLTLMLDSL